MNTSPTDPLTLVSVIKTKREVVKILITGNQLLLGEETGWLEVLDITTSNITSSHNFEEGFSIIDIIATDDDAHYLLACFK